MEIAFIEIDEEGQKRSRSPGWIFSANETPLGRKTLEKQASALTDQRQES
jgi:hypothetical protein